MKYRWPLTVIAAVFLVCCAAICFKYLDHRLQLLEHQAQRAAQMAPLRKSQNRQSLLQLVPQFELHNLEEPEVPKLWPIHRPPVPDAIWTE